MHPDDIRDEKTKVIRSMRVVQEKDIVVGQYTEADGKPGYLDDEGVPNDSKTATCAAVCLWCDNERWEGVPMVIRAGVLCCLHGCPAKGVFVGSMLWGSRATSRR